MDAMETYVRERNAALLSLDEAEIRAVARKYNMRVPDDPEIFWAAVHKARLTVTTFSEEVKATSRTWLLEHGFEPKGL